MCKSAALKFSTENHKHFTLINDNLNQFLQVLLISKVSKRVSTITLLTLNIYLLLVWINYWFFLFLSVWSYFSHGYYLIPGVVLLECQINIFIFFRYRFSVSLCTKPDISLTTFIIINAKYLNGTFSTFFKKWVAILQEWTFLILLL